MNKEAEIIDLYRVWSQSESGDIVDFYLFACDQIRPSIMAPDGGNPFQWVKSVIRGSYGEQMYL